MLFPNSIIRKKNNQTKKLLLCYMNVLRVLQNQSTNKTALKLREVSKQMNQNSPRILKMLANVKFRQIKEHIAAYRNIPDEETYAPGQQGAYASIMKQFGKYARDSNGFKTLQDKYTKVVDKKSYLNFVKASNNFHNHMITTEMMALG